MERLTALLQTLLDTVTALLAEYPMAGEWYMAFVRHGPGSGGAEVRIVAALRGVAAEVLSSTGNKRYMPIAIFHGLCLEVSVPMLVTFFCSVNL